MAYQKFCYWVGAEGLSKIRQQFKETTLVEEARVPCRVLRSTSEIGIVSPSAWESFCKRRTAWYSGSDKLGKILAASNAPLDLPQEPIRISETHFKPDRFPTAAEIDGLANSPAFENRRPKGWDRIDFYEETIYRRWFERYGGDEPFNLKRLLASHAANHANFLEPKFFGRIGSNKAPYSITDSLHTCSSCLEFFNILGEEWASKYVVPCIGAVQFSRLPQDRYLEVTTTSKEQCQCEESVSVTQTNSVAP